MALWNRMEDSSGGYRQKQIHDDTLPYITAWRVYWRCLSRTSIFSCFAPSSCTARSSSRPIVGCCRSIAAAVSLCHACLPPCLLADCVASCHASLCARRRKASSASLSEWATSWCQLVLAPPHWLRALSSWSLAFSLMPTFQAPPAAAVRLCWWSKFLLHIARLTKHSIWWISVWLILRALD